MKVVIIGGVAAGATAAARIRRLDESAEIIIIERSGYISYANCGLPYYVGGVIADKSKLTLQTPESFSARFNIDVRVNSTATAVDTAAKTVTVLPINGPEYILSYDKLVIATGARAVKLDLEGADDPRVFTLRTVEDTLALRQFIDENAPQKALVLGGGYIGLECAETLSGRGISVTLLQSAGHVLPTLDEDMAAQVHTYLKNRGLNVRLGVKTERFVRGKKGITALTSKGDFTADFVVAAVGVMPDSGLAVAAGIKTGIRGAIKADDHMRTSAPDVFAAGDAVEIKNSVTDREALVSLAGPANRQGRVAADNICGIDSVYGGAQGSSVIKLFDMTVAVTGLNEAAAKAGGIEYDKVINFTANHATYYPGASNMTIKTLFSPRSGKLLGAQIVGFDGVDKRIDVLATALAAGMDVRALTRLDLAYAPPYSSAKDPVNMAGYTAENVLRGLVKQFHWYDVTALEQAGAQMLDVRTPSEYQAGHFQGAVNIELNELRNNISRLDAGRPVYVNCHSGLRSYLACRILSENGLSCYNLSGGYRFYALVKEGSPDSFRPAHVCGLPIE